MEEKKLCSIIVPCYNEHEMIPIFYEQVGKYVKEIPQLRFEYYFIDDGSTDGTLEEMKKLSAADPAVHYISFSRNFGKEAGLYAGLENCTGDYVVTMDVDLQDPPELLATMYETVTKEGYDCAATRRVNRKGEPPIRSFFARRFYRLINRMSQTDIVDGARDYRFMTRQMVDSILSLSEYNRFSKGIFGWVGYRTKWLTYENKKRAAGETKWSFWKLFWYAVDGIVAFSVAPLYIASALGILFCLLAFFGVIFVFVRAILYGDPVAGWPSIVCIVTLIGGIILLCLGIMGAYLSKTYLETKKRPIYIAKEKN